MRGRIKGFHHSPETIAKMRGKRNKGIKKEVDESIEKEVSDEEILNEPIEVPAI